MQVVVDRLGPRDWQRARDLRMRALKDAPDAFWVTADDEEAHPPEVWRRRLERPESATFVAHVDGTDVGLAIGGAHHEDPRDAGVYGVWVDPSARGAGVGEALLRHVIDWARASGHRRLLLDVGDHNAYAQRLYRRMGFEPTGATSALPPPREHLTEHELALDL